MNLRAIVLPEAIVSGLEATKRDHAIGELLDRLIACGAVPIESRAELLKETLAREKRGSTGFGHGVAVPHTKTSLVAKPIAALGVSKIGVDFSSLDRQPVHSIIFMLSPKDQPESHIAAMETIFGALSQETFRRFLRQARNRDDVLTLLDETDGAANAGSA
jgi:mannitol/fructose-specific phosphotransferase system IIA component (Ntr-type)